ncbi:MAG: thioredoxin-disulfide reductase [Candidatus Marsarchaeota archaeon]|nr:thioredoxin-disulfide reductase [Candidatus Marsarchaeota archaeon]MCL5122653.1 thioredoxin-disulfide reductase [Candidatus Marsarchaeota archaeon]
MVEDLIIIGAGPAGYTAAIYAARDNFKPLVISGLEPGGQLLLTTTVENYPGFPDGVDGSQLMDLFRKQSEKFGTRFVFDEVTDVDFSTRPFKVKTGSSEYEADSIIIATGAKARWLGIESEKKFIGKGISSCATCDAAFFKGKSVIVVGGGDTAMEDSIYLTKFASNVTIVHRRDQFRASKIMQDRVFANPGIKVIWDSVVEEILGDKKVTGVKIRNTKTNAITEMPVDGVFVAIGYDPVTKFLGGKLDSDELGYLKTTDEVKTKIPGVFVAGDVADHVYRQAITAAGSGAKAALEVRAYLQSLHESRGAKQA